MSHVALVRPPTVFSALATSAPLTMPIAIAYLGANLVKHGHRVTAIDALGEGIDYTGVSYTPRLRYRGLSIDRIVERIPADVDGIGISAMFSQEWPHTEALVNAIHDKFPDIPIIIGGEHATAAAEHILETCPAVSHVALGEGDATIAAWAQWLDGGRPLSAVPGIRYRGPDGPTISTPARRIEDIDALPWPAWDLFDLEPYFRCADGHGVARGRSILMLATRGCPYQCTFCSSPTMWTTRYEMRSVSSVVDEMERYIGAYGVENFDFVDLTAVVKKDWIIELCGEIRRRGLRCSWQLPSGTRSEALDAEVTRAMASAGCRNISYAPESGSERVLQAIKKRVVLSRLLESIRHARSNGIIVKCNLMMGFPGETRWDMLQTLWLSVRLAWMGVEDAPIFTFCPYPGSELYARLRETKALPAMDTAYFESLICMTDYLQPIVYCKTGRAELMLYRILGVAMFYTLGYLTHPSRLLRSLRNWRERRSDTAFEQRIQSFFNRQRSEWSRLPADGKMRVKTPA